jgi:hypothetical protein
VALFPGVVRCDPVQGYPRPSLFVESDRGVDPPLFEQGGLALQVHRVEAPEPVRVHLLHQGAGHALALEVLEDERVLCRHPLGDSVRSTLAAEAGRGASVHPVRLLTEGEVLAAPLAVELVAWRRLRPGEGHHPIVGGGLLLGEDFRSRLA